VLFECEAGVFEPPEDIFIETADRMGKSNEPAAEVDCIGVSDLVL
jgi:hypothetical protein